MAEIHDFAHHPIMDDIEASVSRIVFLLARHQWNTKALYVGQELIIDNLLEIEAEARECRQTARELRGQAASEAVAARFQLTGITDAVRHKTTQLYEEADAHQEARRVLQFGAWLFRYVGDGIAWHAFGHNRRFIRALASKQPVGFLPTKAELRPMRNLFRAARRLGREWLPLLHDITNCLRTADLSLFQSGHLHRVMELKIRKSRAGKIEPASTAAEPRDDRSVRQQERLERIFRFMITKDLGDLDPALAGGKAIDSDAMERHNFGAVSAAIGQARLEGCGFASPEDPLLYLSWDLKRSNPTEAMRAASIRFPTVVANGITFRDMNARPGTRPEGLPLTAMALPPGDILDVLFGRFSLMTLVNLPILEIACAERGVPLRVLRKPNGGFSLQVKMGDIPGEVGEGLWHRLMLEALSVESFAGLVRSVMAEFQLHPPDASA